jgi:glycosyltransferase involved in cell wall biosynthesis
VDRPSSVIPNGLPLVRCLFTPHSDTLQVELPEPPRKILVITGRYPPYHFGGYEIRLKDIVDTFASRGYEILVLSSRKEARSRKSPAISYPVSRKLIVRTRSGSIIDQLTRRRPTHLLGLSLTFVRELISDLIDLDFIDQQIKKFQPDVIYLGHITFLSRAIMPYLATKDIPIVFDEGGSGLIDSWRERGIWFKFADQDKSQFSFVVKLRPFVKTLIDKISKGRIRSKWEWPSGMQIMFNSRLNYQNAIAEHLPVHGAQIIHSGIDVDRFAFRRKISWTSPLTLIVPARMEPRKGQIDAVHLLAMLRSQGFDAKLTLVGEAWKQGYVREVLAKIKELDLAGQITLLPMVPQDELISLYHQSDICFFPSYYRTGFSRIPLDAMACGCIVISYGNEGSDEIIEDQCTGFLIPTADIQAATEIIRDLVSKPHVFARITGAARQKIEQRYAMGDYVKKVEQLLVKAVETQ